jgi:WD40 repeat protein
MKKYAKEYNQIRKYFDYVIDHEIGLIRNNASPTVNQEDQKENNKPELVKLPPVSVLIKAFDKSNNLPVMNNKQSAMQIKKDLIKKMGQFDACHLIRAHSKNNDVNDTATTINDAEFEIAPNGYPTQLGHLPTFTNIAATCGDSIINFIDAETGKIIKRFNDDFKINNMKEIYSRLAWTNINGTSILAAGGSHGQIKLILPKYSVCLNRVDAHKSQILALIFHYKFPNILLSASSDNQIKIWKIDLKESIADIECECHCE